MKKRFYQNSINEILIKLRNAKKINENDIEIYNEKLRTELKEVIDAIEFLYVRIY